MKVEKQEKEKLQEKYEATKVLNQGGWSYIYVYRGGGCNSVVLQGHHQQQFSFRDPPLPVMNFHWDFYEYLAGCAVLKNLQFVR